MNGWIMGVTGRMVTVAVAEEEPAPTADLVGREATLDAGRVVPGVPPPLWGVYHEGGRIGTVTGAGPLEALGAARRQFPGRKGGVVVSPDPYPGAPAIQIEQPKGEEV